MFHVTRRQALAASGGLLSTLLAPQRFAIAAASGTLNIAYNVNLPSFDPQVGPSSVNPTIQAIYRSVFDQYIGQKPNLSFEPGLITAWGWNDDKSKVWMDVRENVVWHDGSPFTPEDVVWSIQREGKADGGNPVAFIWAGIDNFKIDGKRITADVKQYDPVLFKWMAFLTGYVLPKAYFEKVGRKALRKLRSAPARTWSMPTKATPICVSRQIPNIGAARPAFETVVFKFVPDAAEPRSRDRKRLVGRHARNTLRRVRSAQGQGWPEGRGHADFGHRHDLHHQWRRDGRQECPARHVSCGRQADHHQAAAARPRRCHRHARGAGICGLRSLDQGAARRGAGKEASRRQRILRRKSRSSSPSRRRAASSRRITK